MALRRRQAGAPAWRTMGRSTTAPASPMQIPTTNSRSRRLFVQSLCASGAGLMVPAWTAAASGESPWPHDSRVPGGVARLSLGPAAQRPQVLVGDVPVLEIGDMIERSEEHTSELQSPCN